MHFVTLSVKYSKAELILVLSWSSVDQFTLFISFIVCSTLPFFISLISFVTVLFLSGYIFSIMTLHGKWSLMSFNMIDGQTWSWSELLTKTLSIRVAVDLVILVGLVIQGIKSLSKFKSTNCSVFLWRSSFSRSRLWSHPIMTGHFFLVSQCNSWLYSSRNLGILLFGGLYREANKTELFDNFKKPHFTTPII